MIVPSDYFHVDFVETGLRRLPSGPPKPKLSYLLSNYGFINSIHDIAAGLTVISIMTFPAHWNYRMVMAESPLHSCLQGRSPYRHRRLPYRHGLPADCVLRTWLPLRYRPEPSDWLVLPFRPPRNARLVLTVLSGCGGRSSCVLCGVCCWFCGVCVVRSGCAIEGASSKSCVRNSSSTHQAPNDPAWQGPLYR